MDIFASAIKNELRPDETILWRDQPIPQLVCDKKIFWTLVTVGVFSILLTLNYTHGKLLSVSSLIYWFFIVLSINGTVRFYIRIRKTLYLLTNQRAVIIVLKNNYIIESYPKDTLGNYTKSYNSDGSGYILFDGRRGFIGLKDVKIVSDLLDTLVKS